MKTIKKIFWGMYNVFWAIIKWYFFIGGTIVVSYGFIKILIEMGIEHQKQGGNIIVFIIVAPILILIEVFIMVAFWRWGTRPSAWSSRPWPWED